MGTEKIHMAISRGDAGDKAVVEYDAFVLVGWDVEEGGKLYVQGSAGNVAESQYNLRIALKAIASAMEGNDLHEPRVRALGAMILDVVNVAPGASGDKT